MEKKKVVVIGGGLGGLSAAVSLAQQGFQVSLYEKNSHLGGKLNRLEQDGFGFDLGPSILTMTHIFEKLFDAQGVKMSDYIPIQRLDLEWRAFFPNGKKLDLYGNLEKMLAENPDLDTRDIDEYREFLAYAKDLYDIVEEGYFKEGLDSLTEVIRHHGVIDSLTKFDVFSTVYESVSRYISHPELKHMLAYFMKYVGSSPYDAPAILNMMIYMQHAQGAWYVPGGMHKIAEGLVRLGRETGVDFYTDSEVVKLEKEEGRIIRAQLADQTPVEADYFISNMEVIPAYDRLLDESERFTGRLEKKFEPASSGFVLHLGVKGEYPQLAHHNFFFSADPEKNFDQIFHQKELPDDPTIYLVNANKTDSSQTLPGHENIKILPHIPYIQDQPFSAEDYRAFEERVLDKLETMGLTDLRKQIVTRDTWLPEDIRDQYYSHRGAIYGTVSNQKNKGFKNSKKSKLYDNLYFVGGTVNPGGGMPMVTLSGQQVSDKIIQKERDS